MADATLDFVPIDHVVDGLIDIINNWDRAEGKIVHPISGTAIHVSMLAQVIGLYHHLERPRLLPSDYFCVSNCP